MKAKFFPPHSTFTWKRCICASPSHSSSCPFRIKHKVKVLLLIVCGLFSQSLPFDEVITPRQVGGALGAVPQLWSVKLEIPSSSVLGPSSVCI